MLPLHIFHSHRLVDILQVIGNSVSGRKEEE
jgi:hypothetical protein